MTRYIDIQGPNSGGIGRDSEERPEWTVAVCDDDGNPVGAVEFCSTLPAARKYGRELARKLRLEVNDEAMEA